MQRGLRAMLLGAGLCAGVSLPAAEPHEVSIDMRNASFAPAQVSVAAGTRITWTNTDSMPHSVTAADNRFDSGSIPPGKSFQWIADGGGAIAYHCIFHPSMTAVLTIRPAAHTARSKTP